MPRDPEDVRSERDVRTPTHANAGGVRTGVRAATLAAAVLGRSARGHAA
ncbi:hypothetical protein [Natronococcus occultus]|nr:hypothetical protein [Natronococcus occultus]